MGSSFFSIDEVKKNNVSCSLKGIFFIFVIGRCQRREQSTPRELIDFQTILTKTNYNKI